MATNEIIITGVHMDLTEALKQLVHDKMQKLFNHAPDEIVRIRVELGPDVKKNAKAQFTAKGHIEIHGPDMFVSETSEDMYKSIDQVAQKLDRMLRQRHNETLSKRRKPHEIDITDNIPKAN